MRRPADFRAEDGWVLASAIVLLSIMLTVSLATFAFVDTGQKRSREQRERETALNLAEGVLYAQGFALAAKWPGNANAATSIPPSCTEAGGTGVCPDPNTLAAANSMSPAAANFTNVDVTDDVQWTTYVRDNGGPLAGAFVPGAAADQDQSGNHAVTGQPYTCVGPCRWDANGDRQLWVQARTEVRGRPRNVVALLRLEQLLEATPETAVTAGGLNVGNNGNNTMIWARGSQVVVRCNTQASGCAQYQPGQVTPTPRTFAAPPLMTASQLARFKARAITDGTYFDGCPGDDIRGEVVWVENCPSKSFQNSTIVEPCNPAAPPKPDGGGNGLSQSCINQLTRPGILIWHCGQMNFSGQFTYVGIVYGVNNSDGTCPASNGSRGDGTCNGNNNSPNNVVSMTGGFGIWGALAIDGNGCLYVGSNGIQIQFDPNVFGAAASYGTVGLVQNTWRELAPQQ